MTVEFTPTSVSSAKVVKRYTDAYRVASAIITLGSIAKTLGIVFGLLIGVGGVFVAMNSGGRDSSGVAAIAVAAIFLILIFGIIGIVISSVGQLLRATLDTAVHSSPFLGESEKARAMGL